MHLSLAKDGLIPCVTIEKKKGGSRGRKKMGGTYVRDNRQY